MKYPDKTRKHGRGRAFRLLLSDAVCKIGRGDRPKKSQIARQLEKDGDKKKKRRCSPSRMIVYFPCDGNEKDFLMFVRAERISFFFSLLRNGFCLEDTTKPCLHCPRIFREVYSNAFLLFRIFQIKLSLSYPLSLSYTLENKHFYASFKTYDTLCFSWLNIHNVHTCRFMYFTVNDLCTYITHIFSV